MSKSSPILSNMNTGEMSPLLAGRVDFDKYPNGASLLENFIPTTQGPNVRRGGTRFIGPTKDNGRVMLVPFEYSVAQAYVLEFGNFYVRFYTWDATTKVRGLLTSGGVPVEVATPYSLADLYNADGTPRLRYTQSGDFMYLAHGNHQPRILKRTSLTSFVMEVYQPKGGPFDPLITDGAQVSFSQPEGFTTITSDRDIFSQGRVGGLFYIERASVTNTPPWEVDKDVVAGQMVRSDGKIYVASSAGKTGTSRPVHTDGSMPDGTSGVVWRYLDSGYGYMRITQFVSAREVRGNVIETLPVDNGMHLGITSITWGSGTNSFTVTTNRAHGFTNGQQVTIGGVLDTLRYNDGMIIRTVPNVINGSFSISGVSALSFVVTKSFDGAIVEYQYQSGGSMSAGTSTVSRSGRYAFGSWSELNGWPTDVCFFRERLWFGRKQNLWGSVSADFSDFSARSFGQVTADMAISITLVSGRINDVQWMAADKDLVAGTAGGEFSIGELTNGEPLGPSNRKVSIMSQFGTRAIPPIKNNEALLFVQRSGLKARETYYDFGSDGYKSTDMTVLAEHITLSGVTQMAFTPDPDQIVWFVRADGQLIGLTWNNEQSVRGWHRHPIGGNGIVESIAVIPAAEGDRSELWMVVRRTINGQTKRYVEYMTRSHRAGEAQVDQFYVDSGLTYKGAAVTAVSGLAHLEGQVVSVLVNGAPHPNETVTGGAISLQLPGTTVQVGLPAPARWRSMRLEAGARDGTAQGKTKRISKVVLRLHETGGGKYGPMKQGGYMDNLLIRTASDRMDQPAPLFTGDKVVAWPDGYNLDAYLGFEIDQPVAATIVAVMPQITTQDAR